MLIMSALWVVIVPTYVYNKNKLDRIIINLYCLHMFTPYFHLVADFDSFKEKKYYYKSFNSYLIIQYFVSTLQLQRKKIFFWQIIVLVQYSTVVQYQYRTLREEYLPNHYLLKKLSKKIGLSLFHHAAIRDDCQMYFFLFFLLKI